MPFLAYVALVIDLPFFTVFTPFGWAVLIGISSIPILLNVVK